MPLKESKYKYNQTFVKLLGSKIVVSTLGCVRNSDIVCDDDKYSERCSVNDKKLTENIKRSKSKIYELACCNSLLLLLISLNMTVQTSKNSIKTSLNGLETMANNIISKLIFFLFPNCTVTV